MLAPCQWNPADSSSARQLSPALFHTAVYTRWLLTPFREVFYSAKRYQELEVYGISMDTKDDDKIFDGK